MAQNQGKKGGRKKGRNKVWCEAYKRRGQREKNKIKRINKHLKRFPKDKAAKRAVELLKTSIGNL